MAKCTPLYELSLLCPVVTYVGLSVTLSVTRTRAFMGQEIANRSSAVMSLSPSTFAVSDH